MWIISKTFSKLEYSPLIIQFTSLLLIFFSEQETYKILQILIENSIYILNEKNTNDINDRICLRWHFSYKKEDYQKFEKSNKILNVFKIF